MVLMRHLLLVGALLTLAWAAVRLASQWADGLLERIVVVATLVAAAIVLESLALGLAGLGASPAILFAFAVLTAVLVSAATRRPGVTVGQQVAGAWLRFPARGRLALGAALGIWLAWALWLVRYPAYDFDSLSYHIPEVVAWVHNGRPGSVVAVVPEWPYGFLPVSNEVLLSWGTALARSFVWITVWPALLFVLLALSGWLGLRKLRVFPLPSALAVAGLCAAPMLTSYMHNGANSDFPALVWLVVSGALCAAAVRERPVLVVPAVLAAALSAGTKATTLPAVGILLIVMLAQTRAQLRPIAAPLLIAGVAGLVVGGTWYLRDLIEHGSPVWPYFVPPWGDRAPPIAPSHTFLQWPLKTLAHFGDSGYLIDTFLGGVVVLTGAVVAALFTRARSVTLAAAAALLSALFWAAGPDTGAPGKALDYTAAFHGSPRLLMPAVASATLALALATRRSGRTARGWTAVLAVVLAINVWQLFRLGVPAVPGPVTAIIGAGAGALLGLVAKRGVQALLRPTGAIGLALAAGVTMAIAAPGMITRYTRIYSAQAELIGWFSRTGDDRPIYSSPLELVMLSGADLTRRVIPIPRREPCQRINEFARRGWVLIEDLSTDQLFGPSTAPQCVKRWQPVFTSGGSRVYHIGTATAQLTIGPS